jgi:hypothetical protein
VTKKFGNGINRIVDERNGYVNVNKVMATLTRMVPVLK